MVAPSDDAGVRGLHAAAEAPRIDAERAFVEVSSGAYRLEAPLTFATVPALRRAGLSRIAAAHSELSFDLQQVAVSDSAVSYTHLSGALYWEGAVRAQEQGRPVGRGYLELTGYDRPLSLPGADQ